MDLEQSVQGGSDDEKWLGFVAISRLRTGRHAADVAEVLSVDVSELSFR